MYEPVSGRMNMLFDSHVHFSCRPDEADAWAERAAEAGVGGMVAVGGSADTNRAALAIARRRPELVRASIGFDRDCAPASAEASAETDRMLAELGRWLGAKEEVPASCVAIGEIGLDFHYAAGTAAAQRDLFRAQLAFARAHGLPVVVHSREAERETIAELTRHASEWPGNPDRIGVAHCFTGSLSMASALTEMGFRLGFSGIITFPNAEAVRHVAASVPEDRLLIETDAPYLAPVPMRGQRNEPAFVRHVAAALAAIRGQTTDTLAAATDQNARRLFDPPKAHSASAEISVANVAQSPLKRAVARYPEVRSQMSEV